MITELPSGEIFELSIVELASIIEDVIETADHKNFNNSDIRLAIERTNKKFEV